MLDMTSLQRIQQAVADVSLQEGLADLREACRGQRRVLAGHRRRPRVELPKLLRRFLTNTRWP